jgi:hypothetical protein
MTKFAILVLTLSASAAAVAETSTPAADPNEVICRTVRATGSRLATSRRCATRAQWAEDERQQRAQLQERTLRQTNPQGMNPGERATANGRYLAAPGRGGPLNPN